LGASRGYQPEIGTFTAEEWLGRWLEHDTVHLEQIRSLIVAARALKNKERASCMYGGIRRPKG